MSQRASDALAYVSYYREIADGTGQHAISTWPTSADLPDNLAWEVAHGRSGLEGSTVANNRHCILRACLPQAIAKP